MDTIGAKLRAARNAGKLTLREVEQRTNRLAERSGNPAYRVSASWLDRVERENRGLSAIKLIVLASIYSFTPEQLLTMCHTAESTFTLPEDDSLPNATLLTEGGLDVSAKLLMPDTFVSQPPPELTALLAPGPGILSTQYRRGVVGRRDRTLEPMIRAGSIVLIDTKKRSIATRREWNHEFDRPIYFLLTRDTNLVGFCELDKTNEWLTVVPHALSHEPYRRFRYRKEIEVIGTVVAITARRVA